MNPNRSKPVHAPRPVRRPASPEELKAAHPGLPTPEARRAWDEEQRLTSLLNRLPDTPMPDDFTQRVLRALEAGGEATPFWRAWWTAWNHPASWVPRLATAMLLFSLLGSLWLHQRASTRAELATSVASITRPVHQASQLAQLPPVELLRDFEAIDQMRQLSSLADQELLTILAQSEP